MKSNLMLVLLGVLAITVGSLGTRFPVVVSAQAPVVPVASILAYAGVSAPDGYLFANGDILIDAKYTSLCKALAERYRKPTDPLGQCRLPDLRGRVIAGAGNGDELTDRPLGSRFGRETHTPGPNDLLPHTHSVSGGTSGVTSDACCTGPRALPASDGHNHSHTFSAMTSGPVNATSGKPIEISQPSLALNWIIKY